MKTNAVLSHLPAMIKAKRREEKLGLRAAAQKSGVSPSTLSRLERGISTSLPDTETLAKLAGWLNVSLDSILVQAEPNLHGDTPKPTTPEIVEVHLRADKNLSSDTAKTLAQMFKLLYDQVAQSDGKSDA